MARGPKRESTVGRMIRVLRRYRKMSQLQLANKCGLERTAICNIETGYQCLNEKTINAIADALGYRAHVIFRRKQGDIV